MSAGLPHCKPGFRSSLLFVTVGFRHLQHTGPQRRGPGVLQCLAKVARMLCLAGPAARTLLGCVCRGR